MKKKILIIAAVAIVIIAIILGITVFPKEPSDSNEEKSDSNEEKIALSLFQDKFEIQFDIAGNGDFSYTDTGLYDITYAGKAKNQTDITEFSITINNIKYSTITNKSEMNKIIRKSAGNLTMGDLPHYDTFAKLLTTYGLLGGRDITDFESSGKLIDAICDRKILTVGEWNIKIVISQAENTVTIKVTQ